jgi:Protein of unknown function (DUF2613)
MTGFSLAAAVSIAAGLSLGAVATVGATLAIDGSITAPAPSAPNPSGPYLVNYGDRCYHGHCVPCDSKQSCLDKLPPGWRP